MTHLDELPRIAPIQEAHPLAEMQRALLSSSRSAQTAGLNIEQVIGSLREELDAAVLEQAWQDVVNRHSVLRSCVRSSGGQQPLLEINSSVPIHIEQQDWRNVPSTKQEAVFEDWLRADRRRGMVVSEPPLMRLALLRLADAEYRLIWTFHHVLLDARSFARVLTEVFTIYEALREGRQPILDEPRPYREFVEWQRAQDFSAAKTFWREVLRGFEAVTRVELPESPQPLRDQASHGEVVLRLNEEETALLRSRAESADVTLNTFLEGAWALLLSFYSGNDDVVFGAVRSGRRSGFEGAERMVGLLINTVPVRIKVQGEMSVREWLRRLREHQLAARTHEHLPLTAILECSEFSGQEGLFHTLLNFQNMAWHEALKAQGPGWLNRDFRVINQPDVPIWLDGFAGPALTLKVGYDRSRYEDSAIQLLGQHLHTILESLAHDLDQPAGTISPFTAAERSRLLVEWNNTAALFPADTCVHQLFEAQVALSPGALAVASSNRRLTYHELNAQAARIARHLEAAGVRGTIVGVCFDRSPELVVSLVAVLKAGAAYAPLDPTYPPARLAEIVADAGMRIVLTQEKWRDRFSGSAAQVVCLETIEADLPGNAADLAAHEVTPDDLAYIIYTSGSTGKPKGVAVTHRSLMNLVAWHQREYVVTPKDRATLIASPAFDASAWEIWPHITAGASLHVPEEIIRLSAEKLAFWLQAQEITLSFVPTPLAEHLFEERWTAPIALRVLLTGGDRLHRPPPKGLPCCVVNHYGPTESTVVTTCAIVPPGEATKVAPPIGRPIANTQVYLLDRHLRPVPVGVPGELYIGGEGLARGYLNAPELTAKKFIASPFATGANARLYRSGDLARYRFDGQIEFIGRMDQQVKVRGRRIELGEIESLLLRHPGAKEAAAITGTREWEGRLVAFVVRSSADHSIESLRGFLKAHLPQYMLPEKFVFLEALPVTASGKVDRRALAALKLERETARDAALPRTSAEQAVARIWSEVLGLDKVDVQDNFFELGGHSLSAARVAARVSQMFQQELSLHDIFDAPTISAMAAKLVDRRSEVVASRVAVTRNGSIPLSFAQERTWFLEQLSPNTPFNNIPLAFRIQGPLKVEALERALSEIIRRHNVFRTTFSNHQGKPHAARQPILRFVLQRHNLETLPSPESSRQARQLISDEAKRVFDLTQAPLLRAHLIKLAPDEHWLLLITHHIVCDGWSMDILNRELSASYDAFVRGHSPGLNEPAFDYADFAQAQREGADAGKLGPTLAFWKQQLANLPPPLEWPTDRLRPPVQTYNGAVVPMDLPAKLVEELQALSLRENATLFMTLLSAFQTLLHRYSRQEDILTGSPVAGRSCVQSEQAIGLFLNTVVIRNDLSGEPSFLDLLRRTRRVVLDALAHQQAPFEMVADAVQPHRDLSRSPLFQTMFVLQNEPLRPLVLAGVEVTPVDVHSGTAKFDLTLSLEPRGGALGGYLEYNSDLFDRTTVERMAEHFGILLQGAVSNPEARLSQLPLLPDAERNRLVLEWNQTHAVFPAGQQIRELFEQQAARTPGHVAAVFGSRELSFRELDGRAEDVSAALRALRVGPGALVGICVERSLGMLIGLLGILKAGAAYVPLDPSYPKERLKFMLEDSRAAVLVTEQRLQDELAFGLPHVSHVCLDGDGGVAAGILPSVEGGILPPGGVLRARETAIPPGKMPGSTAGRMPAATTLGSDPLAYVIYTSGSTGRPKGVMVTQRNVTSFFAAMDRLLGTEPGTWLAVTSISFDISVLELLWTLTRGFKVIVHPTENLSPLDASGEASVPLTILEQILFHHVTHLQCTPSRTRTFVFSPECEEALEQLKVLLVGGEPLPVGLARELRRLVRGDLLNVYGPTETTIWSTAHRVKEIGTGVPIGRPLANTEAFILDRNFQPVPTGAAGELFIGGEGVARGYLNRPELTAERFVPHPFSSDPAARLYRTGDRVRYRADGTIEFLGRFDQQIKLRGHRIEPGEIEAVLRQHNGVSDCVVQVYEPSTDDRRLAAYVVPAGDSSTLATDLRHFLEAKLPGCMIPSTFVWLDKLPLTPNGKINRQALPVPDESRPSLATMFAAPRTEMERRIAKLWQELLRVQTVGLHDNFFDLGGNSLLVVQEQARLREEVGVNLPVVRLFQYPTIASLADFIGSDRATPALTSTRDRGQRRRAALVESRTCSLVS
jgi:amino acid adenylation domain-containing protein